MRLVLMVYVCLCNRVTKLGKVAGLRGRMGGGISLTVGGTTSGVGGAGEAQAPDHGQHLLGLEQRGPLSTCAAS
jgi:hypothetical protein